MDLMTYSLLRKYVNQKIEESTAAGAFVFKGNASKLEDGVLYDDNDVVIEGSNGDVYQVDDAEYAYNGSEWVLLGFNIDLSNYITEMDFMTGLAGCKDYTDQKTSTIIGAETDTAEDLTLFGILAAANSKLASITPEDNSIVISGIATAPTVAVKIDSAAENILSLGDNGLLATMKVVEENGLNVGSAGIALALATTTLPGAMSAALFNKLDAIEAGAQTNKIETISIGDTILDIVNKSVKIPFATQELAGLVKSSTDENSVAVAENGTMKVNSINVNKLVQTDGEDLILNGGSAEMANS